MKQDLDDLLARYATAPMKEAGFVRSRRRYTVASLEGNLVIVKFSPQNFADRIGFHVDYSVLPALVREYRSRGDTSAAPDLTWGMLVGRLEVPMDLRQGQYFRSLWSYRPGVEFDSVGARLHQILRSDAIPRRLSLLRGEDLVAELRMLRDPSIDVHTKGPTSQEADPRLAELYLTVDHGAPSTIQRLLDEVQDAYLEDRRVDWLRERFARRLHRDASR